MSPFAKLVATFIGLMGVACAGQVLNPLDEPDLYEGPLTGDLRYHREVRSEFLPDLHDVIVYLPPDYDEDARRYPVLYMHDGQNLMDPATAFAGEWHVDEIAEQLIDRGEVEPLIIVGVYNAGERRIAEYTPVPNPPHGGGEAAAYGDFLVKELKPLIDATYRTRAEASSTGLAGSSLGGLVSVYLGLEHPNTFGRIGAVSPSVWWGDRDLLSRIEALPGRLPLRIWIDIGSREGEHAVTNARALRDGLVARGWNPGDDLAYVEDEGGVHNEASWSGRFDDLLRFLYPASTDR